MPETLDSITTRAADMRNAHDAIVDIVYALIELGGDNAKLFANPRRLPRMVDGRRVCDGPIHFPRAAETLNALRAARWMTTETTIVDNAPGLVTFIDEVAQSIVDDWNKHLTPPS